MSTVTTIDQQAHRNRPTSVVTVTPPTAPVLSLGQVRRFVAQSLTDDDDILQMLMESAQGTVSGLLGYPVLSTVREASFDALTARLYLSEPASTVTSIEVIDTDGTAHLVPESAYTVETTGPSRPARITLRPGQAWTTLTCPRSLVVTYTTGWPPTTVPASVLHAVVVLIATHYEQRQATSTQAAHEVPFGVRALLQPHVLSRGVA